MDLDLKGKAYEGAKRVVETCFDLQQGDELLIITDEISLKVAQLIHKAAIANQVKCAILFVPTSDQLVYQSRSSFSSPVSNAMRDVQAILTCVTDLPEAMRFREAVIDEGRYHGIKIGNCPGIDFHMLATAINTNYELIIEKCNILVRTIIRARTCRMLTWDVQRKQHQLSMALGRWRRVPVASTGIISPGLWGNIPSGETYVAPLEETAYGSIVINGSVPGHVLHRGEEIVLTFKKGVLTSIEPGYHPSARILLDKLERVRENGDDGCKVLCELGIGLNPKVSRLTGKPLIDEKKAGTAHIALGNNTKFGGENSSDVHLDLVTIKPTILMDEKPVLDRGRWAINEDDWLEDVEKVISPRYFSNVFAVARSGVEVEENRQGLKRKFIDATGPGRMVSVSVGNRDSALLANQVFRRIPKANQIEVSELIRQTRIKPTLMNNILWLLNDYELVDLFTKENLRVDQP